MQLPVWIWARSAIIWLARAYMIVTFWIVSVCETRHQLDDNDDNVLWRSSSRQARLVILVGLRSHGLFSLLNSVTSADLSRTIQMSFPKKRESWTSKAQTSKSTVLQVLPHRQKLGKKILWGWVLTAMRKSILVELYPTQATKASRNQTQMIVFPWK